MSQNRFQFGDSVRHPRCPEWGIGSVVKAEEMVANGSSSQRLSVRFSNAGLKQFNTAVAELEIISATTTGTIPSRFDSMRDFQRMSESEWLAPLAQKKIQEIMLSLPEEARDVFTSLKQRLDFTLRLYRFDRSGRGIIDWAVAQSGLEDPLSRFTRHELEVMFDRWGQERQAHLGRLIHDARNDPRMLEQAIKDALPDAQKVARRMAAAR